MEAHHTSTKQIVFLSVFLVVILSLFFILTTGGSESALKSAEVLGARLEQEKYILSRSCQALTNINRALDAGSFSFLGGSVHTLEELVTRGQGLSCGAHQVTALVTAKIKRLEATDIYYNCLSSGDCSSMVPALQDIENHFEQRISNIEELKTTLELMEDVLPGDSETQQRLNEASSMISNFYILTDFLFSDVPNVYKIVTRPSDSPSSSDTILSALVLLAFRLLMIISLFIIAPKNIWKLHLFIMKSVIIFLLLVLCLAFYNYGCLLLRSFQLSDLRYRLDGSSLGVLSKRHFIKNIWSVDQFQSLNVERRMMELPDYSQIDSRIQKSKNTAMEEKELMETYRSKLKTISEIDSEEYKDFVLEVQIFLEKHLHVFTSSLRTILECERIYIQINQSMDFNTLESTVEMISDLTNVEEDLLRQKNKLETLLKKVHKLEREVRGLEKDNTEQVRGVGSLMGMVGVLAAPHLGTRPLGSLTAVGLLGTVCAQVNARYRNSVLAIIRDTTKLLRIECKRVIDSLDHLEVPNLTHSIIALAQNADNFYQEEVLIMLRENSVKVKLALEMWRGVK